jgi:mono/diheme cytochrome c family protein
MSSHSGVRSHSNAECGMRNAERGDLGRWRLGRIALLVIGLTTAGCTGNTPIEKIRLAMYDQPKYQPLEASSFFRDGRGSRQPVKGTVARGQLNLDEHFYTGKAGDAPVATFPFPVTEQVLERGREQFDVFCSPCHDRAGTGNGLIVKRGMKRPPSFHTDRLREVEVGYLYDVIRNGFGVMYSYGSRIPPEDRWAIVAYVRTLQLSQHATLKDVPEDIRKELEAAQ